jgi:hypothetical protein
MKERERKRKQGEEVSDTELEDDEDDRDLANSVVADIDVPVPSQPRQQSSPHLPNIAHSDKGKNHAADDDMASDDDVADRADANDVADNDVTNCAGADEDVEENDIDEHDSGDDGDHDDKEVARAKGRRFSKAEEKEIDEFGVQVKNCAEELATKYGRKAPDVLIRAGLGMKLSRKDNIFNIYKKWYAMTHDKDPGCKFVILHFAVVGFDGSSGTSAEWMKIMSDGYNTFMADLASDDIDGRHLRMAPIIDEVKNNSSDSAHLKEPTTRFKSYVKQLEALVRLALTIVPSLMVIFFIGHFH